MKTIFIFSAILIGCSNPQVQVVNATCCANLFEVSSESSFEDDYRMAEKYCDGTHYDLSQRIENDGYVLDFTCAKDSAMWIERERNLNQ